MAGTTGAISASTPPHSERWQRAGVELRCGCRLIHNQWRRKSVLIVDLDCVTDGSCDIAPVEGDVCPGCEARVGRRRKQRSGGSVWGGVGDGRAPAVTVRLAEVVVSRNAVIVTDVLQTARQPEKACETVTSADQLTTCASRKSGGEACNFATPCYWIFSQNPRRFGMFGKTSWPW